MPGGHQQHQVASLRAFLQSGVLGPLNVGMTMLDVSALLGPPTDWMTKADLSPVPHYWSYGSLEIAFQLHAPYAVDWFQIENPTDLARPRDKVADRLLLAMDRIDLSASPSRMLKYLRGLPDLIVATPKDAEWQTLEIYTGGVCIIYVLSDEFMPAAKVVPHRLRHFDENCELDSIYSFRQPALKLQSPKESYDNMSADRYLAIMKGGRR